MGEEERFSSLGGVGGEAEEDVEAIGVGFLIAVAGVEGVHEDDAVDAIVGMAEDGADGTVAGTPGGEDDGAAGGVGFVEESLEGGGGGEGGCVDPGTGANVDTGDGGVTPDGGRGLFGEPRGAVKVDDHGVLRSWFADVEGAAGAEAGGRMLIESGVGAGILRHRGGILSHL